MRNNDGLAIRQSSEPHFAGENKEKSTYKSDLISKLQMRDVNRERISVSIHTFPHMLKMESSVGDLVLVYEDTETIILNLPEYPIQLDFEVTMKTGKTDSRGAEFSNAGTDRLRLAYTTNKPILENSISRIDVDKHKVHLSLDAGIGALKFNITPRLGLNRYIPDMTPIIHRAAQEWYDWFERVPKVTADLERYYYYAWWVMRAGIMSTRYYLSREALASSKIHSTSVWQWDAYLHACAFRFVDRKLSHDQIRILLDHQLEDGMIPAAVHDNGIVINREQFGDIEIKKPPMLAWTVLRIFRSDNDKEFLAEIYEKLSKWNSWWLSQVARNTPDFDAADSEDSFASSNDADYGYTIKSNSPDLSTYLYLQFKCMSEISSILGHTEESLEWERKSDELLQFMKISIDEGQSGLMWTHQQGKPVCIPTPASLLPLISGENSKELAEKIFEQLQESDGLWNDMPIPSVALDDPRFESEVLWRGPSWVSMNLLLIEALDRSGNEEIANVLCERTLQRMIEGIKRASSASENTDYAPIFGWAASLMIEFAIRSSRKQK